MERKIRSKQEVLTNQTLQLPVSDGHSLHVATAGNPNGQPVLFLHGGPGAGINANFTWAFNPEHYYIIGFDQRGCGQSTPFGALEHNTTAHLIEDIEKIRQHFDISSWHIFGGSWGSTLGLCYAIAHPSHVRSLVLRGIFLARQKDFDWFLQADGGAAAIYPDAYSSFYRYVSAYADNCDDIAQAYFELFNHHDQQIAENALQCWFNWEGAISTLTPSKQASSDNASKGQVKSLALLECHYLKHNCFIAEDFILNNAHKLNDIPSYFVHGRYDMVCQVSAAYDLHQVLPKSELHIIDDAGHSASEKGIRDTLIKIMRNLETPTK